MENKTIDWFNDILPNDHKYVNLLKKIYRHEFRKNGFKRITTPIFEKKDFIKSLKQDKNFILENEDFEIRSEPYYWILRAYLDKNLQEEIQPLYFYFMESFVNKINWKIKENLLIWSEIIWEDDPILDALQIYINYKSLCKIWLENKFEIFINSLWNEKEKIKFKEELISFYENKKNILTEESRDLIEKNPILILKSENEDEKILNENAPVFTKKFLKKETKAHYQKFKEYLEILEVPFKESNSVVCDDENQTKSIWVFKSNSWEIISKWYRHNSACKNIWSQKEIPATWSYLFVEKVIEIMKEINIEIINKDEIDLFFVQLWEDAKKLLLPLTIEARNKWLKIMSSLWTSSMKEQMLKAQRSEAKFIVMVWIMEAKNWIFQVRNQRDWTQTEVKKEDLINYIIEKIWEKNLDFYDPSEDLIIKK